MTSLIVSRWRQSFTEARTTLHNERRSRSSSNPRFPNVVKDIQGVIDTDWRLTLHKIRPQLSQDVQISHASLISNYLCLSKVCSRLVPLMISDQHKEQRFDAALQFQLFFKDDGDALFDRIVTRDK